MHIEEISSIFVYSNTFKEMLSENVQKLSEKCKCQCRINIELRFLSRGWFWTLVQISWVIQHFAILKQGVFCSMTIIRSSGNLTHESLMISARSNWGEKRQLCLRTVKFKPSHHLFLLIWRVWNFTLTFMSILCCKSGSFLNTKVHTVKYLHILLFWSRFAQGTVGGHMRLPFNSV